MSFILPSYWSGNQTRSFLYIDDCIDGTVRLMQSDKTGPYNIGSSEMVSIKDLIGIISKVENKHIKVNSIKGPTGVVGRNSNNDLTENEISWSPKIPLSQGIEKTYLWIKSSICKK